jgi:hypothetical protein
MSDSNTARSKASHAFYEAFGFAMIPHRSRGGVHSIYAEVDGSMLLIGRGASWADAIAESESLRKRLEESIGTTLSARKASYVALHGDDADPQWRTFAANEYRRVAASRG